MPVPAHRIAAALLSTIALCTVPAAARADDAGCSSASQPPPAPGSACDAGRPLPTIAAAPATPLVGATVTLTASSGGRGIGYAWDLDGDGQFDDASGATATTSFASPGAHVVAVRATDEDGRSSVSSQSLTAHAGNIAPTGTLRLTGTSALAGRPITITAHGSDADGSIGRIEIQPGTAAGSSRWFGPGEDATLVSTPTFAALGTQTISATFTDDDGATSSSSVTLDVHADDLPPVVSLTTTPQTPVVGAQVTLAAAATDPDGSIADYRYDLDGDGSYETGGGARQTTSFATAGDHVVGVRVTDAAGAVATTRTTVHVVAGNLPPDVRILRTGTARQYVAVASDADGSIDSYAWDLDGDGRFDDGAAAPGSAVVTLPLSAPSHLRIAARVTDSGGATTIASRDVAVVAAASGPPRISFSPLPPRVGAPVGLSVAPDGDDVSDVAWDLDGDGSYEHDGGSALSATAPGFATPGPHTVGVRLRDSHGGVVTGATTIDVSPATGTALPVAIIASDGLVARLDAPFTLTDASVVDGGAISQRSWTVDGRAEGTGATIAPTFATTGSHVVALTVTDRHGAVAVQWATILVGTANRAPQIGIYNDRFADGTITAALGTAVPLTAAVIVSDDPIARYAWSYDGGAGPSGPTAISASPSFTTPGLHEVTVVATDAGGATATASTLVDVRAAADDHAPIFTTLAIPAVARTGAQVELSAVASDPDGDPVSYAWDLGNGQFADGAATTTQTFGTAGSYPIRVRASDGFGGVTIFTQTLTIKAATSVPPAIAAISFAAPVRAGVPSVFTVDATAGDGVPGGLTLTYDMNGDGVFDETPAAVPGGSSWTFTTPVTISVKATDALGRSSVRSLQVTPSATTLPPRLTLRADTRAIVAGATVPFVASATDAGGSSAAGIAYAWDTDGDGAFDDGEGDAFDITFDTAGRYTIAVRATDASGATATVSRTFDVGTSLPVASLRASTSAPQTGQDVTFTSTSTGAIASQAWDLDDDGAFDDGTDASAHVTFAAPGRHLVGLKVRSAAGDAAIAYVAIEVAQGSGTPTPTATPTATVTPTPTESGGDTPAPTPTSTPPPVASVAPAPTPAPGSGGDDGGGGGGDAGGIGGGSGGGHRPAPRPGLNASIRRVNLATLRAKGIPVTVSCARACRVSVAGKVDKATARRLALGKSTAVGSTARSLKAHAKAKLTLKLTSRAKRPLTTLRSLKLTLTIVATTKAGGRERQSATVKLRR